ncbi:hypothetical protein [Glaciihabitans sp. GrIS 2.15]|uniref:hypothetical protein n=1 Tax=Glaciihabitans sp. GrIS 2.15 TaxID=3071710 RepID=UPI002E09299B|nr:hypothetical protein [Glaciihabitans sp. GrIS 2.15]
MSTGIRDDCFPVAPEGISRYFSEAPVTNPCFRFGRLVRDHERRQTRQERLGAHGTTTVGSAWYQTVANESDLIRVDDTGRVLWCGLAAELKSFRLLAGIEAVNG